MDTYDQVFYFTQTKGGNMDRYLTSIKIPENDKGKVYAQLISAKIYNTVPNITASNNLLVFSVGGSTYNMQFPPGIYDINSFNAYIRTFHLNYNIPLIDATKTSFVVLGNNSTQTCQFYFNTDCIINLELSTINKLIGFPNVILNGTANTIIEGDEQASFNTLSEFVLHSNLVNSIYSDNNTNNAKKSDIFATIPVDAVVGYQIIYEPVNPIFVEINLDNLQYLNFYWTNEKGDRLDDLINDPWSILIRIFYK